MSLEVKVQFLPNELNLSCHPKLAEITELNCELQLNFSLWCYVYASGITYVWYSVTKDFHGPWVVSNMAINYAFLPKLKLKYKIEDGAI